MSRGGFRGGRGGGRGGFGRGGQVGPDIDGLAVSFHDIPLFPEMKLPPVCKKLLAAEVDLLALDKAWAADFKDSPYFLELPPVRDDVERYSDRFKSWARPKTKSLTQIPTDLKYFPEELHQVKDPSKKPSVKMAKGGLDLDKRLKELEKEESSANKRQKTDGIDEEDQPETNEYDEEDQEEEDDYQIDHYDDDHDGLGDESDHGGGDY